MGSSAAASGITTGIVCLLTFAIAIAGILVATRWPPANNNYKNNNFPPTTTSHPHPDDAVTATSITESKLKTVLLDNGGGSDEMVEAVTTTTTITTTAAAAAAAAAATTATATTATTTTKAAQWLASSFYNYGDGDDKNGSDDKNGNENIASGMVASSKRLWTKGWTPLRSVIPAHVLSAYAPTIIAAAATEVARCVSCLGNDHENSNDREDATSSTIGGERDCSGCASAGYETRSSKRGKTELKKKSFVRASNLHRRDERVRAFVESRALGSLASSLLNVTRVRLYQSTAFFKEPGDTLSAWHYDQVAAPLDTDEFVTIWIPLDTVRARQGTLKFARGSHLERSAASSLKNADSHGYDHDHDHDEKDTQKKSSGSSFGTVVGGGRHQKQGRKGKGVLSTPPDPPLSLRSVPRAQRVASVRYLADGDVTPYYNIDEAGDLDLGDATAHLGWTLHRADGNPTTSPRRAFACTYVADGARVYEDLIHVGPARGQVRGVELSAGNQPLTVQLLTDDTDTWLPWLFEGALVPGQPLRSKLAPVVFDRDQEQQQQLQQ